MSTFRAAVSAVSASRQRGVVLLYTMIAVLIIFIGVIVIVRQFQGSLFNAGNIGFKRDLQNQGEKAVAQVLDNFSSGKPLSLTSTRAANASQYNYSATALPVNGHGLPTDLLLSDFDFASKYTGADLASHDPTSSVKIRYVVDRLCNKAGDEAALSSADCVLGEDPTPAGTSESNLTGADRSGLCSTCISASSKAVVFRISVVVTGPRQTQSFFQSTFSAPQ